MANITAKFRLIDEMSSKLDNIAQGGRNALNQWERAGDAIDNAFVGASANTARVAQSLDSSSDSADKLTMKLDEVTNASDKLSEANKDTEDGLEKFNDEVDKTKQGLGGLGEETEKTRKKQEDYDDSNRKTTDGLKELEELLVAAGIVRGLQEIGDAFIGCVEDAIEFESAITGVYKTVDGTDEQLATIAQEVKDLSLVIPSTTTEIAAVAEAAGQLGIATEDVMAFTEVMINLGESTNLSSDEAASSLAKFANITKMSAENYENLGSTVVALGNNFATTEADIVAMSTRMASAGSLAELSEAEILALAAAVSSVGIEADAGGSSMSRLLSQMQLAVETGSDELEQFASVSNMTVEEFQQKWGESAVDALYAFIAGLNDTERNGASATAILDEMGITEIRLSNAIKSLASNHEGMSDAIDLANNAWSENTALATEANTRYSTLESKLAMTENAQKNLSTAIGEVFTPTVSNASDVWAGFLNGLTGFVKENPTAVKAIVAITVGVSAFTVGIVAYTTAIKVAKIAQAAFNAVALANPYVLLTTGIIAAVAALGTFAISMADANDETTGMTATTREQYYELKNLEAEYEKACNTYGETSTEASRLRYEMDELEASFEANRQTVEEFVAECDSLIESSKSILDNYAQTSEELESNYLSNMSLIQKLEDLANQNTITASSEEQMRAIIAKLNKEIPELSLNYEDLIANVDTYTKKIKEAFTFNYEDALKDAQLAAWADAKVQVDALYAQWEKAKKEAYAAIEKDKDSFLTDFWYAPHEQNAGEYWQSDETNELILEANALYEKIKELEELIVSIEEKWEANAGTTDEAADKVLSYSEVCEGALSSVEDDLTELCTAYNDAYIAAGESIDGQIGLFDEIVLEVEQSTEEMMGAWESQINYLASYAENLKKAMEFGLDKTLVEQLSDGSKESAAQLDTIISKVEELGGSTEEAKAFVDEFNGQFQKVGEAKKEFKTAVAEMKVDFVENLDAIETQLHDSIENMDASYAAKLAATDTMSAYIQALKDGGNEAVLEALNIATRVSNAFNAGLSPEEVAQWEVYKNTTGAISNSDRHNDIVSDYENAVNNAHGLLGLLGYASGTDNAAPGVALVGENGPELVEFDGGETVYPADETSRILARVADASFRTSESAAKTVTEGRSENKNESKTIRLDINGSGAIEVDKSMSEETVVNLLYDHLKPALMSIVRQEIYEEGDLAYDF